MLGPFSLRRRPLGFAAKESALKKVLTAAMLALALTACGRSDQDIGGVSPDEAEALNEAAETLDAQAPPPLNEVLDVEAAAQANAG